MNKIHQWIFFPLIPRIAIRSQRAHYTINSALALFDFRCVLHIFFILHFCIHRLFSVCIVSTRDYSYRFAIINAPFHDRCLNMFRRTSQILERLHGRGLIDWASVAIHLLLCVRDVGLPKSLRTENHNSVAQFRSQNFVRCFYDEFQFFTSLFYEFASVCVCFKSFHSFIVCDNVSFWIALCANRYIPLFYFFISFEFGQAVSKNTHVINSIHSFGWLDVILAVFVCSHQSMSRFASRIIFNFNMHAAETKSTTTALNAMTTTEPTKKISQPKNVNCFSFFRVVVPRRGRGHCEMEWMWAASCVPRARKRIIIPNWYD